MCRRVWWGSHTTVHALHALSTHNNPSRIQGRAQVVIHGQRAPQALRHTRRWRGPQARPRIRPIPCYSAPSGLERSPSRAISRERRGPPPWRARPRTSLRRARPSLRRPNQFPKISCGGVGIPFRFGDLRSSAGAVWWWLRAKGCGKEASGRTEKKKRSLPPSTHTPLNLFVHDPATISTATAHCTK